VPNRTIDIAIFLLTIIQNNLKSSKLHSNLQ